MNRARVAMAVVAVLALFTISGLDRAVHDVVIERRDGLGVIARVITVLGSSAVLLPASLVSAALFWQRGVRPEAVVLLAGPAVAAILALGIKVLVGRDRPPADHHLIDVDTSSFPSGHATHAAAFGAAMVAILWARAGRHRTLLAVAGASTAVLVGTTRLIVGVHWFSDVVAGWALGAATIAMVGALVARLPVRGGITAPEIRSVRHR